MVGILRMIGDDYGALACLEHRSLHNQTETVDIMLVETSYAKGRSFVLGQGPCRGALLMENERNTCGVV
jgi:hypothetical protein